MHITNTTNLGEMCQGKIEVAWYGPNGELIPVIIKNNVITFRAADIMANILAGDTSYIPTHVGYLYGPAAASMTNPESGSPKRLHTFDTMSSDLAAITGNMIVSPLANNPSFAVDGDTNHYERNSVTLNAISDSTAELVFNGPSFASAGPQPTTDKYFQMAILTKRFEAGSTTPTYIPFARSQLASGNDGIVVQASFELSVFWTMTFK